MRAPILALSLLAAVPMDRAPATATATPVWYDVGHRLVVRIALLRLTPHTLEAMRDLLGGQDPVEASLWADQIRGSRRETGALHFVNIPLNAEAYSPEEECPRGQCIVAAIERDRMVLADSTASLPERAEALRFLLHLMGDLHQPLHVSDHDDRGGNDRAVELLGRTMNLHQVWDGEMLKLAASGEDEDFERLRQTMANLDLGAVERGSVIDWAMEGHRAAVDHAYRLPPSGRLGEKYVTENLPVVDLALISAGVRLARVLNEALAGYRPGPPAPVRGDRVYSDREAAAHEGENATVVGVVVSVHRTKAGNIFLNFGADYPRQTFSGAVLDPRDPALLELDSLTGRRVGIRGRIQRYKGQLEIVIESAEQIVPAP
jgi:hypothetical protein